MMDRFLLWEMSQIRRHELLALAEAVRPRGGVSSKGATSAVLRRSFEAITHTVSRGIAVALREAKEPPRSGSMTAAARRCPRLTDRPEARPL
jgi:hypothetical protein